MGRLLSTVEEMLTRQGWEFERAEKREAIVTGVQGRSTRYRIAFDAKEEAEQLILYVISPTLLPEEQRLVGCEFVTRANYGLILGNLELDMSDGEVRYKVSVDVEGSKLSVTMARNMLGCGVAMMDRYYAGLMAIGFGGKAAAEAVAECEAD